MSLTDTIKERVKVALKAGKDKEIEKNILRMALAEVQNVEIEQNKTVEDSSVVKILKKLRSNNEEFMASYGANDKLVEENKVLSEMIPNSLDAQGIRDAINGVIPDIIAAKNAGAATGVAMQHLKKLGLTGVVDGNLVKEIVTSLRA